MQPNSVAAVLVLVLVLLVLVQVLVAPGLVQVLVLLGPRLAGSQYAMVSAAVVALYAEPQWALEHLICILPSESRLPMGFRA